MQHFSPPHRTRVISGPRSETSVQFRTYTIQTILGLMNSRCGTRFSLHTLATESPRNSCHPPHIQMSLSYICTIIQLYTCTTILIILIYYYTAVPLYYTTILTLQLYTYMYGESFLGVQNEHLAPPPSEPPSWVRPNVRHSFATPPGRNLGQKWPWKPLGKRKM